MEFFCVSFPFFFNFLIFFSLWCCSVLVNDLIRRVFFLSFPFFFNFLEDFFSISSLQIFEEPQTGISRQWFSDSSHVFSRHPEQTVVADVETCLAVRMGEVCGVPGAEDRGTEVAPTPASSRQSLQAWVLPGL